MTQDLATEEIAGNKIHIRGVDELKTNDIIAFATEHFPSRGPDQIEWIDDTSANIVYESSDTAADALLHFTSDSNGDLTTTHPLQLRTAKPLSTQPNTHLQIRIAIITDQKRPRAAQASRFYMMHPELDPREQRRRSNRQDRHGGSKRPRYGDDENRRRKRRDDDEGFTASMYDDDAEALASRDEVVKNRRISRSSFSSTSGSGSFRGDLYRPNSDEPRRLRDRSASPTRQTATQNGRRERRRTPPPRYSVRDPHPISKLNTTKELFPSKGASRDIGDDIRGISPATNAKELFPNKQVATNLKKELFPLKAGPAGHHRSNAFDAADETTELFAAGMTVPFVDGAHDSPSQHGRLKASDPDPDPEALEDLQQGGFRIRGMAKKVDRGLSILGAASRPPTKELFPTKAGGAGNTGKELFADKLQGRGGRRNLAVDMFN